MQSQAIAQMEKQAYGGRRGYYDGGPSGSSAHSMSVTKNYITEQQNFLKNYPLQIFNLTPDQNGIVTYTGERLRYFAHLTVLVVDKDSIVQHNCCLQEESIIPIPKRNLTLNKALDENKGLTQTRETCNLLKGEKDNVPDFLSSEIQLIDDLKKVNDSLK